MRNFRFYLAKTIQASALAVLSVRFVMTFPELMPFSFFAACVGVFFLGQLLQR